MKIHAYEVKIRQWVYREGLKVQVQKIDALDGPFVFSATTGQTLLTWQMRPTDLIEVV